MKLWVKVFDKTYIVDHWNTWAHVAKKYEIGMGTKLWQNLNRAIFFLLSFSFLCFYEGGFVCHAPLLVRQKKLLTSEILGKWLHLHLKCKLLPFLLTKFVHVLVDAQLLEQILKVFKRRLRWPPGTTLVKNADTWFFKEYWHDMLSKVN